MDKYVVVVLTDGEATNVHTYATKADARGYIREVVAYWRRTTVYSVSCKPKDGIWSAEPTTYGAGIPSCTMMLTERVSATPKRR